MINEVYFVTQSL